MPSEEVNELASEVLDYAFALHKKLGPGLLESAYQECLFYDLEEAGFEVQKEVSLPIKYKELEIGDAYRVDLLIENELVVELKSVEHLLDKHKAQVLTYLRFGNYSLGLLLNFNEKLLKNGIKRIAR